MALNEQMKEAIQADIADESSKKERLAKQVEGLKSTGKFIGETAVESIPGVSEAIAARNVSRDIKEGDYVGAGIETIAGLAGLAPAGGDALAKAIRTFKPKKTVKAYKLFTKGEDGNLYPLFVDADTPIKRGEYIQAVIPDSVFTAPNGKKYVPSKGTGKKKGTGDNIPIPDKATRDLLIEKGFLKKGSKAKSVKAVALRPGWHAGDSPAAPHIGNEYKGKKFRAEDQVWAEVEMPADVDWQSIANKRAELKKDGTPNVKTAHITDELPLDGFYRYKTNPNMQGNWLISGQMKINRVLDADEVKRLNKEAGTEDLPTLDELKSKDMAKGGAVMDDYQFAELDMDQTQKFAEGGMSKQMDLFEPVERGFDDGGLMQEGGSVDPVSGNDVPVGSTQEEVRDDIPAQLSEGEFVFPADVVRYIGLENLMRMRQEAKMGLAQMEAMGQMGNSEEATMPDDLPFDMYDLEVDDDGVQEFAQGGVVQAAQGMYVPPQIGTTNIPQPSYGIAGYQPSQFASYGQQATQPSQPFQSVAPVGSYTPPTQQYTPTIGGQTPTTFTGFTGMAAPGTGGYDEMKTYVNDAGMEMQIPFKDGNPIYPIPEGYTLKGDAVKTTQTQTTTGSGNVMGEFGGSDDNDPKMSEYSTTDVTGIGYNRSKIEHQGIKDILTDVAKSQVGDLSIQAALGRNVGLTDIGKTGLSSQFKGVMDNFRGKTTKEGVAGEYDVFADTRNLHDFTTMEYDDIVSRFTEVQNQMKDIYGSTKPDGEFEYNSLEEIRSGLADKARELGIDPNRKGSNISKHQRTLEKEIAAELDKRNQEAKDSKGTDARTEQAMAAAAQRAADALPSGYKIDTTGKTPQQIRAEVSRQQTKKKEDDARKEREEASRRAESSGRDYDYDDGPDAFGGTGQSSGTDFGGSSYESDTGEAMVAEGGLMNKNKLAKQMEKSGLTPKK